MRPLETLFIVALVVLWLVLLVGIMQSLRTGIEEAQGRYREVKRINEPRAYWLRMAANVFGLFVVSLITFAALASAFGVVG